MCQAVAALRLPARKPELARFCPGSLEEVGEGCGVDGAAVAAQVRRWLRPR